MCLEWCISRVREKSALSQLLRVLYFCPRKIHTSKISNYCLSKVNLPGHHGYATTPQDGQLAKINTLWEVHFTAPRVIRNLAGIWHIIILNRRCNQLILPSVMVAVKYWQLEHKYKVQTFEMKTRTNISLKTKDFSMRCILTEVDTQKTFKYSKPKLLYILK